MRNESASRIDAANDLYDSDVRLRALANDPDSDAAQVRALPEWLHERIARIYRGRGDSACGDDLRAGNVPPTTESDLDTGTLLAHVGLGDGLGDGEETRWLLDEYETEGEAVVALARESVIAGYLARAREDERGPWPGRRYWRRQLLHRLAAAATKPDRRCAHRLGAGSYWTGAV